jgi:hypothetical protein
MRFDRVDVSNTLDAGYIGIPRILSDWGTLLKNNNDAAVVGYFMNWARSFPGSSLSNSDATTIKRLTTAMMKSGLVSLLAFMQLFIHSSSPLQIKKPEASDGLSPDMIGK